MRVKKLPAAFKEKWVKALRSGNFKQGPKDLLNKADNTYCCLGVACKIVGHSKDEISRDSTTSNIRKFRNVPIELRNNGDLCSELAGLNDDNIPFPIIAGIINEYL